MNQMPVDPAVENDAKTRSGRHANSEKEVQKKKKNSAGKSALRIVITLVIIAVGIFLILFLVAKASRYDSIGSMLQHMGRELSLMWQRIIA